MNEWPEIYHSPFIQKLTDFYCKDIDSEEVNVAQIKRGFDRTGKNVETEITLVHELSKVVLHFYNTKLIIKVDGKTAIKFAKEKLVLYYKQRIASTANEISKYNDEVLQTFQKPVLY